MIFVDWELRLILQLWILYCSYIHFDCSMNYQNTIQLFCQTFIWVQITLRIWLLLFQNNGILSRLMLNIHRTMPLPLPLLIVRNALNVMFMFVFIFNGHNLCLCIHWHETMSRKWKWRFYVAFVFDSIQNLRCRFNIDMKTNSVWCNLTRWRWKWQICRCIHTVASNILLSVSLPFLHQ